MELDSVLEHPGGVSFNDLVNFDSTIGDHWMGAECPFGTRVAFSHEGLFEEGLMTLYNVTRSGQTFRDALLLIPDPGFPPLKHKVSGPQGLGFVHDACLSGLGGFASALDFLHSACGLPGRIVSAIDFCPLAMSAYKLNHAATPILMRSNHFSNAPPAERVWSSTYAGWRVSMSTIVTPRLPTSPAGLP